MIFSLGGTFWAATPPTQRSPHGGSYFEVKSQPPPPPTLRKAIKSHPKNGRPARPARSVFNLTLTPADAEPIGSGSRNAINAATQLREAPARRRACAPHHLILQAPCGPDQIPRVRQINPRGRIGIRLRYVGGGEIGWDGSEHADILADRIVLVPLTTSLYVPGRLADSERVIVDVGTGFYVEKVGSRRRHIGWGDSY